ncbi:leucine-rich repeat and WD repeat-containing protein 1 [Oreochromis aureus]|uniref:Leucine-rich repeat and WD repeat-containing protein 1 n=2 Tax=Oreochromis aureus TaxID=47969 RepID=A0A668VDC3_OREAU|nr:leucine-rich repeat and WD repeat-containing protein 1 [Oreochromis aureus]
MEKITEKVLLKKASPKANKLEQIMTLNLSKMRLKLQDLPVKLLSRLQSLEKLDLSGNMLQEFPKNLELPALRFLDLSDNQIEDVTTLDSLSNVEELRMDDNLYITVSDTYKLMVLLPNLRIYNGKDVSTSANHLRYVYSDNLRTRIAALWENSFCLPNPITAEKMDALESKFVSTACLQVKFGPNSVSDFTRWRVGILAKEYLLSLTGPKKEVDSAETTGTQNNSDVSKPAKRKQTESVIDTSIRLRPLKKPRTDPATSAAEDSPRQLRFRLKPQLDTIKNVPSKTSQAPITPSRGERRSDTRKRSSKEQQTNGDDAQKKQKESSGKKNSRRDADMLQTVEIRSDTQPVRLNPLHVLQCHSKQDSLEDFSTQLWACAFQPLPDSAGNAGGSRLVATCGGDSICLIDCEMGMVMKKYKVPGEEFYSLAWSTVLMSRGGNASAQHCSILAAGGKRGIVKLIHPRNNVAYGEFRASRKALSVLRFNHQQGNFLFTGSYDNKILMWDIGGVDSQYNFKVVQLLVLEIGTTPLHICLPPTAPSAHLLTACEDGLHCYNTQLGANNTTKRSKEMEITFPIYKKEDKDHDYHTVDGLGFLNDDIVASKNYLYGCIYLWSWSRTKVQRPDKKSKAVCAVVLAELQWANTEIPYLALNTCPGQAYMVCGDDKGKIWTYHIPNLQKNSFHTGKPILPTEVLEWPTPVKNGHGKVEGPSINSVAMDPELRYLVALSDKNMVIVWKREESP